MLFKRVALIVVLALAMIPSSALADTLDFSFGNGVLDSGPTVLNVPDSFGLLTTTMGVGYSSNLDSVTWVRSNVPTTYVPTSAGATYFGSVDITTGPATSVGSFDNGATFAGGAGMGQITITSNGDASWGSPAINSCLTPPTLPTGIQCNVIFSGFFSGPASWVEFDPIAKLYTLTGDISLDPGYSTGNTDFPTFDSMWPGLITTGHIDLTAKYQNGNSSFQILSGDVYLPEPGTLSLLGLGLLGLAALLV